MTRSTKVADEDEDWDADTDRDHVKVRASRILGPRENYSSKRRNHRTLNVSPPDSPIYTEMVRDYTNGKAHPSFESFAYNESAPNKRRTLKINPPLKNSIGAPQEQQRPSDGKQLHPKRVEEAAYDGSQPWLDLTKEDSDLEMGPKRSRGRKLVRIALSSDDDDDYVPRVEASFHNKPASSSGRNGATKDGSSMDDKVVIELSDAAADDEAIAELLQKDELMVLENGFEGITAVEEEVPKRDEGLDLIHATLRKCDRIAAELKQELHPHSVLDDCYAEVDPSTAKIVTQMDVCAACGISCSDGGTALKPYQLVGVNFMMLLNRKNVGGAILADEMGLGKTVQAVAFLALLKHLDGDHGPHLIVCPASVLENWQRELNKWCPSFKVVLFHGNERAGLTRDLQVQRKAGDELPFNVMLTCYSMFERRSAQQKDDRGFLRKWQWSCVLMDEAHFLKDRTSLRARRLRELAQKAKQRVMLTGTPLHNDLQELWSLLEFLLPDIFDTGKADLSKLLGTRNRTETVLQEESNLINQMKAILSPFVLRRLKSDVMKQLVPKIHKVKCVDMVPDQALAYREAVEQYRDMTAALRAARKDSHPAATAKESVFPKRQIQNIFTQLRKVANHPLLVRRIYTDQEVEILARKLHAREVFGNQCTEERVLEELKGYNDFTLYQLCIQNGLPDTGFAGKLSDQHPLASAKCQVLSSLLPELKKNGHRPLIFSQWTQMLDILEWALDVLGLTYVRLDGSTQVRERQEIVDNFNNDSNIFIFLLSTRAGGQGLNLTGADTVVIHDVDFNPQMDRQAEDRCHRIGQSKPVTVYRLVTKGSVDESIYNIAQRKLVLDAAVLESKENGEHVDGDAQTMEEILSAILAAVPS